MFRVIDLHFAISPLALSLVYSISAAPFDISRPQLLQQRLRLLQIARAKSLSEPPVHRSQQFASLLRPALVAPEACEAGGGAKFEQERTLLLRDL